MKRASMICMTLAVCLFALLPWSLRAETRQIHNQNQEQKEEVAEDEVLEEEKLSFETKDLFGESIDSEELFADHKITMINIWTSWCGPCLGELPELEALNQEFAEKDCAIVGLLYDGVNDSVIRDAKEILEETGVTYPILLPWEDMPEVFAVQAVPTSFFVDSEGNLIGEPVIGALIDQYTIRIDEALKTAD